MLFYQSVTLFPKLRAAQASSILLHELEFCRFKLAHKRSLSQCIKFVKPFLTLLGAASKR